MSTVSETTFRTKATLNIPAEAYDAYERRAATERKSIDQVFSDHLAECVHHKARKGFWVGDQDRASIEDATRTNISSASDLVGVTRKAMQIRLEKSVDIALGLELQERLRTRCFDTRGFEAWLKDQVLEKLQEVAGLR